MAADKESTFDFFKAFSSLVTMMSSRQYDWVARTGRYSIHALLTQISPEVRTSNIEMCPDAASEVLKHCLWQALCIAGDNQHNRFIFFSTLRE